MNKLKLFFTNNLKWKLSALVMAVILWILAVNIEDPLDTRSYSYIPIELKNTEVLDEYDLVLLNREEIEKTTVTVNVWANTKLLQNQLSSSNIKAYIDMSPIRFSYMNRIGEALSAPIEITLPEYATSVRSYISNPTNIRIVLDRKEKREFPVNVVKTSDTVEGYVSMEPVASPATVELTGAASILDSVQSVRVDVDLDEIRADHTFYSSFKIYDQDDNDITNKFSVSTNEISVFIPVNRHEQIPVAIPVITGFPAEGYTITNVELNTTFIDVVGKEDELNAVTRIILDSVDVTGLNESSVITRDVRDFLRSTNLSVKNGKPHEVSITVTIEKEMIKEFTIPLNMLEIIGDQPDAEFGESVVVRLKGLESAMSVLTADSIKGSIDISELSEGEHAVAVMFNLPVGISRVGDEPVINVYIPVTEEYEEDAGQESADPSIPEGSVETPDPEPILP